MAFCISCGQELAEGAKFCASCGKAVNDNSTSQRKTVYEGEIHKCPSCGEVLTSFITICPTCGHELRGTKVSNSVQELATKLQQIESRRNSKSHSLVRNRGASKQLDDIDEQKINLIKSFVIPNNKEDIIEFAVLAASNVDKSAYDESQGSRRRDISDAWLTKLEQAYQKAKIVLVGDTRLNEIQTIYDSTHKSVKKAKWAIWKQLGICYAVIMVIALIFFVSSSISEKNEIKRLEGIEGKIEIALSDGDYKYALMNADYLIFDGDEDIEREWKIKRDYWIDKIIEEAAQVGVILERPTEEESKENSIGSTHDGFKYENYLEVKSELEERGFTNITTQGLQDLTIDWLFQDGDVEKVTVAGETGFPSDMAFPLDVEIVIYFHSYEQESSTDNEMNDELDAEINVESEKNDVLSGRFEEGTYKTIGVKNFEFEIPNYWAEEGSKNEYLQYYAEKGDKCVMLSIEYPEESDDSYDVSLEGLVADNENMIEVIQDTFTEGDVIEDKVFESDYGVKGILYHFTFKQEIDWFTDVDGSGTLFCFPSEKDRRWFWVYFIQTNNISGNEYKDDFISLISSIKEK